MGRPLNPRLVGVRGPAEGAVFALAEDEVSIGRDDANTLKIEDRSVSRRHCSIRKLGDREFEIRDLGSRTGTAVNGLPIWERVLADGDEIRLGECHFVFLLSQAQDAGCVQFDEATLDARTFHTSPLPPAKPLFESASVEAGVSTSLAVLIRMGIAIQTARSTQEIAQLLMEEVFKPIPAERGAVLLFEGMQDEPAFTCSRDRLGGPAPLRAFSEIVAQVRRGGVAVLATAPSPEGMTRVLAAPITAQQHTLGMIYLEGNDPAAEFDDKHLELATAIGGIVGMPLENARRLEWLESENRRLQEACDIEHDMVGASPRMREVFQFVSKVAPTDSTILIRGESGTGKELVAQAIHRNSPRAGRRFAAINCAAIAESLLESELFGHERGAFTGAMVQKKGKLEVADGGTLFLDEVGELPLPFQAKLLRVLQEREFERVGGTHPIRVDVRLIAATNTDLESAMAANAFRTDLYYRLNVVSVMMPPLRERREDIPLLARHFIAKHGRLAKRRIAGISLEALACLEAYPWPGNVRELENALERAVVLGSTDLIIPEDLPESVVESTPTVSEPRGGYYQTVREEKKRAIVAALKQSGGKYTEAAKLLGVHPNYLHRLVRNLDLKEAVRKTFGD